MQISSYLVVNHNGGRALIKVKIVMVIYQKFRRNFQKIYLKKKTIHSEVVVRRCSFQNHFEKNCNFMRKILTIKATLTKERPRERFLYV